MRGCTPWKFPGEASAIGVRWSNSVPGSPLGHYARVLTHFWKGGWRWAFARVIQRAQSEWKLAVQRWSGSRGRLHQTQHPLSLVGKRVWESRSPDRGRLPRAGIWTLWTIHRIALRRGSNYPPLNGVARGISSSSKGLLIFKPWMSFWRHHSEMEDAPA